MTISEVLLLINCNSLLTLGNMLLGACHVQVHRGWNTFIYTSIHMCRNRLVWSHPNRGPGIIAEKGKVGMFVLTLHMGYGRLGM
jgi:hypothetical protein